jgi:hypothetical protein
MTFAGVPLGILGVMVAASAFASMPFRQLSERLREAGILVVRNFEGKTLPVAGVLPAIAWSVSLAVGAMFLAVFHIASPAITQALVACIAALCLAAIAGFVDDVCPVSEKGFRGHLMALVRGRITPGFVKLAVVGIGSALVAAYSGRGQFEFAVDTVTIALTANAINLLDLRPGRAVKVVLAGEGVVLTLACIVSAHVGSAASVLLGASGLIPFGVFLGLDLRKKAILGDSGANPAGVGLGAGFAFALSGNIYAKLALLALVFGINLFAETGSITKVIDDNRILKALDELGVARNNTEDA